MKRNHVKKVTIFIVIFTFLATSFFTTPTSARAAAQTCEDIEINDTQCCTVQNKDKCTRDFYCSWIQKPDTEPKCGTVETGKCCYKKVPVVYPDRSSCSGDSCFEPVLDEQNNVTYDESRTIFDNKVVVKFAEQVPNQPGVYVPAGVYDPNPKKCCIAGFSTSSCPILDVKYLGSPWVTAGGAVTIGAAALADIINTKDYSNVCCRWDGFGKYSFSEKIKCEYKENPVDLCIQIGLHSGVDECRACQDKGGIWTAIGCISTTGAGGIVTSILRVALGILGGSILLVILYAGFLLATSRGETKTVENARSMITAAITGALFILFSMVLLQTIGIKILQIPGF